MKFENREDGYVKYRGLTAVDKDGDALVVEVESGKRVFIHATESRGVELTRPKALKLAWAIINELNPSIY
jgi:hypothetical protein